MYRFKSVWTKIKEMYKSDLFMILYRKWIKLFYTKHQWITLKTFSWHRMIFSHN